MLTRFQLYYSSFACSQSSDKTGSEITACGIYHHMQWSQKSNDDTVQKKKIMLHYPIRFICGVSLLT